MTRLLYTSTATIDLAFIAYISNKGFIQMKATHVHQTIKPDEVIHAIRRWEDYLESKEFKR